MTTSLVVEPNCHTDVEKYVPRFSNILVHTFTPITCSINLRASHVFVEHAHTHMQGCPHRGDLASLNIPLGAGHWSMRYGSHKQLMDYVVQYIRTIRGVNISGGTSHWLTEEQCEDVQL